MNDKQAYIFVTKNKNMINTKTEYLTSEDEVRSLLSVDEEYRIAEELSVFKFNQGMTLSLVFRKQINNLIGISGLDIVYTEQEHIVKADLGSRVELQMSVYHEGQTLLSHEEIIEEAIGYAEDVNIEIDKKDIVEVSIRSLVI